MRPPAFAFKIALILVTLPVLHCQDFKTQAVSQVLGDGSFIRRTEVDNSCRSSRLFDATHKYWDRDPGIGLANNPDNSRRVGWLYSTS